MKEQYIKINHIPALLLGEQSDKIYIFVHGQGGNKEEARLFAEVALPQGWQVLGIDLPEHGARANKASTGSKKVDTTSTGIVKANSTDVSSYVTDDESTFDPWHAVGELKQVLEYARANHSQVAVRANSIGSYFSLLAYKDESLSKYLLVSPLLDMERMIENLMKWSGVTEERLEQEKIIPTNFGQTLSWEYLCYARDHRIEEFDTLTSILRDSVK